MDAALGLARELLAVMPNQEGDYLTRVRTRCGDYNYEKILAEYIPKLVSVAEKNTLRLLCDLLSDTIQLFKLPHKKSTFDDNSHQWHPSFEGTWENCRHDLNRQFTNNKEPDFPLRMSDRMTVLRYSRNYKGRFRFAEAFP